MLQRGGAGSAKKEDKQVIMELSLLKLHLAVKQPKQIRIEWVRGTKRVETKPINVSAS